MKKSTLKDHAALFSNNQGSGYIFENETDILEFINPVSISVGSEKLNPGDMTDLNNYLTGKVKYLGCVMGNGMIFHYGTDRNLFPKSYYGLIFRVTQNRIFEMFSASGGRDNIFKNGNWK